MTEIWTRVSKAMALLLLLLLLAHRRLGKEFFRFVFYNDTRTSLLSMSLSIKHKKRSEQTQNFVWSITWKCYSISLIVSRIVYKNECSKHTHNRSQHMKLIPLRNLSSDSLFHCVDFESSFRVRRSHCFLLRSSFEVKGYCKLKARRCNVNSDRPIVV